MRTFSFLAIAIVCLTSNVAQAASYEVNVTRKGSNSYQVDGKSIRIITRYCYAYAYSEEAILKSNGYGGGDLIFLESKDKCDIKAIYTKNDPKPGKYKINVTHESDDWYEVQGVNIFLQTSMCLSLTLGDEAFLKISPGGYGTLIFDDGQSCTVEATFSKIKLD
jgi:hypothetical protein